MDRKKENNNTQPETSLGTDELNPSQKLRRFAWVKDTMPGVAKLIVEKRALWGDAHVNECWRRGVVERQPGWFFAREGAVALGTPWDEPVMANFAALNVTAKQALLVMAGPEFMRDN
jgi:hypothetical protein